MKERPKGFLSDENLFDSEIYDYIKELHGYLWEFIRVQFPFAGGRINKYIDVALEQAKWKADKRKGED